MPETDNSNWIVTAIDMAYNSSLEGDARDEAMRMVESFFDEALARGCSLDHARAILGGEFRSIMPVREPLKFVLARAMRKFEY